MCRERMEKIKSGITGLDEIMGGGIPRNQLVLVTGTSGTGKTTISTQFIHEGATKYGENGVYLSFEEPDYLIKENVKQYGWDLDRLEKEGKFSFIKYDPFHIEDVFEILQSTIKQVGARRVVVDSISALGLHVKDDAELRRTIFNLSVILRKMKCTSILVSEIVSGSGEGKLSRYGVEEFVADSVIVLYYERSHSAFVRAIQAWKVRGSAHSEKIHPYKIGNTGVIVYPHEEAFIER